MDIKQSCSTRIYKNEMCVQQDGSFTLVSHYKFGSGNAIQIGNVKIKICLFKKNNQGISKRL